MNKPVSILCLSDLHYEGHGDMKALDQLGVSLNRFISQDIKNLIWQPDYLVIAGDVAQKPDDYIFVEELLNGLFKYMPWLDNHIVIVPGNHDKKAQSEVDGIRKEKEVFDAYCKNTSKGRQDFCDLYYNLFKDYLDFYEKYVNEVEYDESLLDEKLKLLGGLRYYKEDNVCFLMVNTEWLYVRKKNLEELINQDAKWIKEHLRIEGNCKLCTPLVKSVRQLLEKKYPDALVITVMHRPFDYLTWDENNYHNDFEIDAVGTLLNITDILITGHDHTINTTPPLMINNRVQHYKLGSAGRKEKKESEEIRTASIIRIDPVSHVTDLLHMKYDPKHEKKGGWTFWVEPGHFSVVQRYNSEEENLMISNLTKGSVVVRAKYDTDKGVKEAIRQYYRDVEEDRFFFIEAASNVDEQLFRLSGEDKGLFVVIYFKFVDFMIYGDHLLDSISDVLDKVKLYRENHIMDILCGKMIFNYVFVETPKKVL